MVHLHVLAKGKGGFIALGEVSGSLHVSWRRDLFVAASDEAAFFGNRLTSLVSRLPFTFENGKKILIAIVAVP
jgi:hypothetical protein